MDAKAAIKLGHFSRGGQTRVVTKALDHDFADKDAKVQLFGFYLVELGETYLYFIKSPRVTADAIADCLQDLWLRLRPRFRRVRTLLVDLDNGPENNSRRSQFINRLVEFADNFSVDVQLAYYPPYHSKYNPIERVWGVLEQHWNGSLLDCLHTAVEFAKTMTYQGLSPYVTVVERVYDKGVKLTKRAMDALEQRLERLQGLAKYFVTIPALSTALS